MAIKEKFMVKTGMSVDTLSIKADPGEAFLVKEIGIDNLGNVEFAKLSIDRMTLAYLSAYDNKQNQFYFPRESAAFPNLMAHLLALGVFAGFPVKEGQEFTVDITGANTRNARIIYEVHDGEDITDEMQGATGSKEYVFFNYGTNKAEIGANANGDFDKCLTPAEFPDFPFGAIVPAKTQIEIMGLLIGTHRKGVYFGDKLRYLKFSKGREVMFDEDRTGFYCAHGMNYFPFHAEFYERTCVLFPEPLVFGPGDELILNMSVGGVALAADGGLICLIQKVTKLE
ncbi:hypothetical protein ES702_06778 [subsurface metagenome]